MTKYVSQDNLRRAWEKIPSKGIGNATSQKAGLMSAADKKKLDGIKEATPLQGGLMGVEDKMNADFVPYLTDNIVPEFGGIEDDADILPASAAGTATPQNVVYIRAKRAFAYKAGGKYYNNWTDGKNAYTAALYNSGTAARLNTLFRNLANGLIYVYSAANGDFRQFSEVNGGIKDLGQVDGLWEVYAVAERYENASNYNIHAYSFRPRPNPPYNFGEGGLLFQHIFRHLDQLWVHCVQYIFFTGREKQSLMRTIGLDLSNKAVTEISGWTELKFTDTTYPTATAGRNGLMSAADKKKLDNSICVRRVTGAGTGWDTFVAAAAKQIPKAERVRGMLVTAQMDGNDDAAFCFFGNDAADDAAFKTAGSWKRLSLTAAGTGM